MCLSGAQWTVVNDYAVLPVHMDGVWHVATYNPVLIELINLVISVYCITPYTPLFDYPNQGSLVN